MKSRSTAAYDLLWMEDLAIKTKSNAPGILDWFRRKTSRIKRLALFRTTALPTLRLTTTPSLEGPGCLEANQLSMRHPRVLRRPAVLIRVKSQLYLMRLPTGSPWEDSGGVEMGHQTGVRRLRPLRRLRARIPWPLLVEFLFRNPYCRFRRILDG